MKQKVRFNKTDVCSMVGIDNVNYLGSYLSDDVKNAVGFKTGVQYFSDKQVFTMLKDLRQLATDEQIIAIIYPRGIVNS